MYNHLTKRGTQFKIQGDPTKTVYTVVNVRYVGGVFNNHVGAIGYNPSSGSWSGKWTDNFGSGDSTTLGGYNNIGSYGTFNHASGYGTMANAINVTESLAIGPQALFTAGVNPIQQTLAIGGGALFSLDLPGNENVAIGWESQNANTGDVGAGFEGNYNVSLGVQSLLNLDGGYRNTAIGHNAGSQVTSGIQNTISITY